MHMYMNKNTGSICFLTLINSNSNVFEMEYETGFMKYKLKKDANIYEVIDEYYVKIGFFPL